MSPDQVRKLVGGYATGTLTPEERQALFEAALDDQQLFDALAREQSLRDLLGDPAAKAELLAALGDAPATWRERGARWVWGHAPVLAALACFVTVSGYVARQWRLASPPEVAVATEPTAPPRRVFDPNSVKKPAAPLPALPAPPVLTQAPVVAQALPPAVLRGVAGGSARIPVPAPPAPSRNVTVNGIADLDASGNLIQRFEPATAAPAEPRPMQAGASGAPGGAGGGGGGGGFGGMRAAPAAAGFGNARLAAGAVTGALTGSIVDSSGAAVPGAQVEVKNLVTGAVRNTVSGPAGLFVLNSLEPARYSLTARATGFKTYESTNLDVTASGALNLGKVPLALGALTEEIAVTAAATPVQTASSENSKLADSSQIADLTLKGRDLFAELATAPGVSLGSTHLTGGNATSESSGLQSQINGAIAGRANVTVNGVTGLETGAGKLDPALAALLHGPHAAASGALVIVRIALANATKDALAQLKKAGVTIGRRKGNDVTGRVAVQNLDAVARLAFVVWIAPQ